MPARPHPAPARQRVSTNPIVLAHQPRADEVNELLPRHHTLARRASNPNHHQQPPANDQQRSVTKSLRPDKHFNELMEKCQRKGHCAGQASPPHSTNLHGERRVAGQHLPLASSSPPNGRRRRRGRQIMQGSGFRMEGARMKKKFPQMLTFAIKCGRMSAKPFDAEGAGQGYIAFQVQRPLRKAALGKRRVEG